MAVMITNASDHRYVEVNEAFERLTGHSREEVIGRTSFDIDVWANPSERLAVVEAAVSGKGVRDKEYLFRTRDGRVLTGLCFADFIEIDGVESLRSSSGGVQHRTGDKRGWHTRAFYQEFAVPQDTQSALVRLIELSIPSHDEE